MPAAIASGWISQMQRSTRKGRRHHLCAGAAGQALSMTENTSINTMS